MNKTLASILISFIGGFLSAYAFAPTYCLYLLPFTLSSFAFVLFKANNWKKAFYFGWAFGFGYFLNGSYWVSFSLSVGKASFGWLSTLVLISLPATYAIYFGVFGLIMSRLKSNTYLFTLFFITLWIIFEILRLNLFTGFPILLLGYTLSPHIHILQIASIFGVYGLSFIVLSLSLLPFLIINSKIRCENRKSVYCTVFLLVSFSVMSYGYGFFRIKNAHTQYRDIYVRLVQPNVPQALKWDHGLREGHLSDILDLSSGPSEHNLKLIIWPESATPGFNLDYQSVRDRIKHIIPQGSYLISGGGGLRDNKAWNSLVVIDSTGHIVSNYDKAHLVPFGEYVPLKSIFPFMSKATHGAIDVTAGVRKNILINEEVPLIRPLICYESLFPDEILVDSNKPELLINVSNDAWYGDSPGPYQNADISKLRSIEYGIPMVRVANTGISFVTDAYGRILHLSKLNEKLIIDSNITFPLAYNTFYSKNKLLIFISFLVFKLGLLYLFNKRSGVF